MAKVKHEVCFNSIFEIPFKTISKFEFNKLDFSKINNSDYVKKFLQSVEDIKNCNFIEHIGAKEIAELESIIQIVLDRLNKKLISINKIVIGYLSYNDMINQAALQIYFDCKDANKKLAFVETDGFAVSLIRVFTNYENELSLKENSILSGLLRKAFDIYFEDKYGKKYVNTANILNQNMEKYELELAKTKDKHSEADAN